jgi:pantoate--beta-alanine ligase
MSDIKIFRTVPAFRVWRKEVLLQGRSLGLVPTMGALHAGHMSLGKNLPTHPSPELGLILLVEQARRENDVIVISIFVNPAQFAPHEDFEAYPRTWDADKKLIEALKIETIAIFMPTNQEMYPRGISMNVEDQQGAFVEVLGLSEPASLKPQFSLTTSARGFVQTALL